MPLTSGQVLSLGPRLRPELLAVRQGRVLPAAEVSPSRRTEVIASIALFIVSSLIGPEIIPDFRCKTQSPAAIN